MSASLASAIRGDTPVVALESSVLAQGLPIPANREAAERMLAAVARAGATAAITAVVAGELALGLIDEELERFLSRDGVRKVGARDLAPAQFRGWDGATTVSAAMAIAHAAGVPVFATGGIGGVHRGNAYDESADLLELSRLPLIVVCSGAKSILDLAATVERLETLGVTVVGFRTETFPAFFTASSGLPVSVTVETPAEIAELYALHRRLSRPGALLVVQPPPAAVALLPEVVHAAVELALEDAARDGVKGPALTPFLLAAVERATGGRSLEANLGLLEQNAGLAGEVAVAWRRGTE